MNSRFQNLFLLARITESNVNHWGNLDLLILPPKSATTSTSPSNSINEQILRQSVGILHQTKELDHFHI